MKIVFIIGCFEKGKDGVGDYARTLSAGITERGHECFFLALNDRFVQQAVQMEKSLRIPADMPVHMAEQAALNFITATAPDLISLQFVFYAYSENGFNLKFLNFFSKIHAFSPVHLMFHELWVDIDPDPGFKFRVTGFIQRYYIRKLTRSLSPSIINTSNVFYLELLKAKGIPASILPIFSNIKPASVKDYKVFEKLTGISQEERQSFFVIIHFGTIHKGWDITLLDKLISLIRSKGKKPFFISAGNQGNGSDLWLDLEKKYQPEISFTKTGFTEDASISQLMYFSDAGLCTTPVHLLGKSGSFMAMKEHGLPSISVRNLLKKPYPLEYKDHIDLTFDGNLSIIFDRSPVRKDGISSCVSLFLQLTDRK